MLSESIYINCSVDTSTKATCFLNYVKRFGLSQVCFFISSDMYWLNCEECNCVVAKGEVSLIHANP